MEYDPGEKMNSGALIAILEIPSPISRIPTSTKSKMSSILLHTIAQKPFKLEPKIVKTGSQNKQHSLLLSQNIIENYSHLY